MEFAIRGSLYGGLYREAFILNSPYGGLYVCRFFYGVGSTQDVFMEVFARMLLYGTPHMGVSMSDSSYMGSAV